MTDPIRPVDGHPIAAGADGLQDQVDHVRAGAADAPGSDLWRDGARCLDGLVPLGRKRAPLIRRPHRVRVTDQVENGHRTRLVEIQI